MKVKNILSKTVVVGAVLTTTMVLGAVSAFAAPVTTDYIFGDITNEISAEKYTGKALTLNSNDTTLTFTEEKSNTIKVYGTLKSFYITYANSDITLSAPTEGSLKDESLEVAFSNNSGGNSSKALIGISDIKANDKVEVYWAASSNTGGKTSGTGTIAFRTGNNKGDTLATSASVTSNNDVTCTSFVATDDLSELFVAPSSRAVIFAVSVTTGNEAAKKTTVSGNVDSKLASSGTIGFTAADGSSGTAAINEDGTYTVDLNQGTTYTVSLDSNDDYVKSAYVLATTSVDVGTSETQTINIEVGDKLTSWDFTTGTLPVKSFEGLADEAEYKGLIVDSSNGKFAVSSNRVQFNAGTVVKVPVSSANDTVTVQFQNGAEDYTLEVGDEYATITATKNIYLQKITVEAAEPVEDTTPYLTFTTEAVDATKTKLGSTINNVNADNKVTAITVKKGAAVANITNLKDNNDGTYSFFVNIVNTTGSAINGSVNITYAKGDASETKTYSYVSNADASITVNETPEIN